MNITYNANSPDSPCTVPRHGLLHILTSPCLSAICIHCSASTIALIFCRFTSNQAISAQTRSPAQNLLVKAQESPITRQQLLDTNQLQRLSLTLNRPNLYSTFFVSDSVPNNGTSLPPGYHLASFTSAALPHHSQPWCREVENHREFLVHGPLDLINMLDFWRDTREMGNCQISKGIRYPATTSVCGDEQYRALLEEGENGAQDGSRQLQGRHRCPPRVYRRVCCRFGDESTRQGALEQLDTESFPVEATESGALRNKGLQRLRRWWRSWRD